MANRPFGTIYVGATSNLVRRVYEHRNDLIPSFTREHRLHLLVYLEPHQDIHRAIQREHNIKHWSRAWKNQLIEAANPEWDDLYLSIAPG